MAEWSKWFLLQDSRGQWFEPCWGLPFFSFLNFILDFLLELFRSNFYIYQYKAFNDKLQYMPKYVNMPLLDLQCYEIYIQFPQRRRKECEEDLSQLSSLPWRSNLVLVRATIHELSLNCLPVHIKVSLVIVHLSIYIKTISLANYGESG